MKQNINQFFRQISSPRRQFQDLYTKMYPELIKDKNLENADEGRANLLTKTITFIVTENCSLRCSYCYQCDKNFSAKMDFETAKKSIDTILNDDKLNGYMSSKESPCLILEFIGGEPLLEVKLMDQIVEYFRYKALELNHPWGTNHMISFTSNGTHYFKEETQTFLKKYKDRLSFTITIDGNKELHDACRLFPDGSGSYDIVEKSIKHAIQHYNLRTSKITLAPENISYFFEAVKHLFDLGLDELNANCVYEDVWVPERDAKILYDQMIKLADYIIDNEIYTHGYCSIFDETIGQPMDESDNKNWCGGNGQMLAIGTDGRFFPCLRFMKYSLANKDRREIEIGDYNRGIDTEETNELLNELHNITRKSQSTDECFNCPTASGCSWCSGYNYDQFGTLNKRATYICWMHKTRVLANHYYWTKLYNKLDLNMTFDLNLSQADINFILNGGKHE